MIGSNTGLKVVENSRLCLFQMEQGGAISDFIALRSGISLKQKRPSLEFGKNQNVSSETVTNLFLFQIDVSISRTLSIYQKKKLKCI